ncbi:secreted RxLR effector protein 161-like [Ixodes scapularis]|uniref:secreted RxLR effector protein 161-like n=1 Tax=Ixodes scapularis TaxID=6945 RepID=UPI001A9EAE6F|nr:secreted RxLR effector protein 161-like [Ixodes scapularis]
MAFATTYVSQLNEHPTEENWSCIKHILRYVKQTKNCALIYQRTGKCVQVFCDADRASDKADRKSFNGYVLTLAGAAISWSSRKQQSTALSTVEAEYMTMCPATKEVMWLENFMKQLGVDEFLQEPQVLLVDNQGAIVLAKNQVTSERSKHIDLKHFFLREKVEEGKLQLQYNKSSSNSADLFTKALNGRLTLKHCERLGVKNVDVATVH